MDTLRLLLNKLLGKDTVLDFEPLGIPLRLSIEARREIQRVRAISEEAALIERMFDCLHDGDTIYDIGANIGVIALLLARHPKGGRSRVHCFEPEPRNFEQLLKNISHNDLSQRVSAHRLALSDRSGELDLFVRGGPGEGRHSTVASDGSTGSIQVSADTASSFASSSGELPDVVKIDVEGAEGRVLAGMSELMARGRPREIFMELHPKGERDRMPDGRTIEAWLGERGYHQVWRFQRGRSVHCHYR